jgi:probable rRNA maturation factor
MSIQLSITNHTRGAVDIQWLERHLRKLLKLQKVAAGNWSITIVNDREMKSLHQRTMNNAATTDVLTFDLRDKTEPVALARALDLDTILCRDEAARRAKELHHSINHELLLYALHSLLHVRGYDDLTPRRHARMHRREDTLLIALGIGPLYKPIALRGNARLNRSSSKVNRKPKTKNQKSKTKNRKSKTKNQK